MDSLYSVGLGVVFSALLILAAVSDMRTRRIPNRLVLVILAVGILSSLLTWSGLQGLTRALAGVGVGFAIWLPFWFLRWLGAGDVKLIAAAGAWIGGWGAVEASVYAALIGGALTVGWLVWERGWGGMTTAMWVGTMNPKVLGIAADPVAVRHRVPYAVALAAGLLIAMWFPGLLAGR